MPRFSPFLLSFTLLAPAAHAQTAPVPIQPVSPVPDTLTAPLALIARDFKRSFYDDIIERADTLIGDDEAKPADPRLLYWRGLTFYQSESRAR